MLDKFQSSQAFLSVLFKCTFFFLKSNLELALSIVLKQRELYESKHVVVECRCLKIMILVLLFDMFLNPSFKVMATFANIARTTAGTSKFIY